MFSYWIRSLSARLWITSVMALAICLGAIAAITVYTFTHSPPQMLQRHADIKAVQRIAAGMRFNDKGQLVSVDLDDQSAWLFSVAVNDLMYRILDDNGHVLLASSSAHTREPWPMGPLDANVGAGHDVTIDGRPFDLITFRTRHEHAWYTIQIATSIDFNKAIVGLKIRPIPDIYGWTVALATIIFGLTLTLSVHRLLLPLRLASRAASSITPSNLETRLSDKGMPSEIKPLITAFNDTLSRLEKGFIVQQAFLASVAHELQTPLTLIRGQIELQPEIERKELIFREIDLMARQVRQLLHLAEVSESQNFVFGDVNYADVAEEVVNYFDNHAINKNVLLELDSPVVPPVIKADKSALFILLKNLVENAINVTTAGGRVTVTVSVAKASIEVRDEGCGIDPDHVPFLFQRFWRAPDESYQGAGLGLAICKEIALAHGWRIDVTRAKVGTAFSVLLNA